MYCAVGVGEKLKFMMSPCLSVLKNCGWGFSKRLWQPSAFSSSEEPKMCFFCLGCRNAVNTVVPTYHRKISRLNAHLNATTDFCGDLNSELCDMPGTHIYLLGHSCTYSIFIYLILQGIHPNHELGTTPTFVYVALSSHSIFLFDDQTSSCILY